ncbi:MAG TPA: transposase [Ktedonobacteraceae bacterium]|nr:transposase [Ktedonobacteraceae bacterium]
MKPPRTKRPVPGKPQRLTKAVTHIRLLEINPGKLAALDALAPVYLVLCQQYVTLFCTNEEPPDKFHPALFPTPLSERWHRVAIQQAAGIAQSWRTSREQAYQDYFNDLLAYHDEQDATSGEIEMDEEPVWKEWDVPTLKQTCIQANVNVVKLEVSQDSSFDYWLKISTLDFHQLLLVPVKLANYHRQALSGKTLNSSVQLNRREDGWWLTLSYDEIVTVQTELDAPVIGIDVGIANFVTTSDGKHYGTFHGKLREQQKRDRQKRQHKAKLRACLQKKGVTKLPSTSSRSGDRLIRHVKQEINRAVSQCFTEHQGCQFAYERLSVATMRYKARAMNAYLHASNLAHVPKQIAWNAAKRGVQATRVKSAYSSQQCGMCYYVDKANRPDQHTFCCQVCGHSMHADVNAALNIERRVGDLELQACKDRRAVKVLLLQRHESWKKQQQGWS